ncbi:MAG TPA: HD domain-containing protein [Pirellulaceae bacterium]|nr:HD domain-containing protein [Pirellulaceae bacterium]
MNERDIIPQTAEHVRSLLAGDATGHDWFHIERVRKTALAIAREEGADLFVVELAALLHDVADWKFAEGDHTASPRAARRWLEALEVNPEIVGHIEEIIAGLSFKGAGVPTPMRTLEGQIVQDADRLDALGAIGIARTFAYGGHKGQPLHDPSLPAQSHASFEAYKNNVGTSINHFYEKLLLLKDRMNTATGRRLAEERHTYTEQFLEQFFAEWDGKR